MEYEYNVRISLKSKIVWFKRLSNDRLTESLYKNKINS